MAVTLKNVFLWRREVQNRPGTLAETLKPLAEAGVNLQVIMGYAFPGQPNKSAIELYPIATPKAEQAARAANLEPSDIPCLLVEGDNDVGIGHKIADALYQHDINISFVIVQVVGKRYLGIFGFESQGDLDRAKPLIKDAAKVPAKHRKPRTARAKARKTSQARTSKKKTGVTPKGGRKSTAKKATKKGKGKSTAKKATARKTTAKKPAKKAAARKKTTRKK